MAALTKFQRSAVDDDGNVLPNASIEVFFAGVTNKPTIYSDAAGTVKANPFNADVNGFIEFYIAYSVVDIEINGVQSWTSQKIGDPIFDTVSDFASARLSVGEKIENKGCLSVGDGGHGVFIVEAASGTPDGYGRVLLANGLHAVRLENQIFPFIKWDNDPDVIVSRHTSIKSKIDSASIAAEVPTGFCVGNSIMQGTGSSTVSFTIPQVLAQKLLDYTGVGAKIDWVPANRSVGGSRSSCALTYVADNADNADILPETGNIVAGADYCVVLTLRNDVSLSYRSYRTQIAGILQSLKNKSIDAVFVIDPPKINFSTGEIDEDSAFIDIRQTAIDLCSENDATVVDVWKYLKIVRDAGYDIKKYYYDSIHPNDDGYELISELIFQAMIAPSKKSGVKNKNEYQYDFVEAVSAYSPVSGSVITTSTISGLVTSSTARKTQTGEATTEAFVLGNGDTIGFDCPAPCHGIILSMLGGVSGSASMSYTSVSVSGSMSAEPSTVRESAVLFSLVPGVTPHGKKGRLVITSSGTTRILGVVFLCERVSSVFDRWIDAIESGTWSDSTFYSGGDCRQSSTVGDYVDVNFYGSYVSFKYQRSTSSGKFNYSVDGGSSTEVDAYLNASPALSEIVISLGNTGWHTVRFEIVTKNAASSANTVKFGDFRKYIGSRSADVDYVSVTAGDTFDHRTDYDSADILRIFSGSPQAYDGLNGKDFTLNGTGSALVKLSKK